MNKPKLFNSENQKEQSDKYRYQHIHTGEWCTFEAYIAERIILRKAEKLGIERPAYKFWTKGDPNHWTWMKQLNATRALVKKYSEKAVLAAVNSKSFDKLLLIGLQNGRGWKINPKFEAIVIKCQRLIDLEKEKVKEEVKLNVIKDPVYKQVRSKKNNILNKLRGNNGDKAKTQNEKY